MVVLPPGRTLHTPTAGPKLRLSNQKLSLATVTYFLQELMGFFSYIIKVLYNQAHLD